MMRDAGKAESAKPSSAKTDGAGVRRRAYATPRLIDNGSVAKLTQGGGSLQADGGSTFKRMQRCL